MKLTNLLFALVLVILVSCGKKGDPGPVGPQGPQGSSGPNAVVLDFKYVHSKDFLGAGINSNYIFQKEGGLKALYNRDTDGLILYMKSGAVNDTTKNFTLVPLPTFYQDSIKIDYDLEKPTTGQVNDRILDIFCYVPDNKNITGFGRTGHYPFKNDTTIYYRAIIIKGGAPLVSARLGN